CYKNPHLNKKKSPVTKFQTQSLSQESEKRWSVSFNPQDNTQVCITGNGFFKLFKYSEGYLKQMNLQRGEPENYLCHAWLSEEEVICGTDTGKLSLFETGELHWEKSLEYRKPPRNQEEDTTKEYESLYAFPNCISGVSSGVAFEDNGLQQHSLPQISAVAAYSKGFACSPSPGVVLLFEKTCEKEVYEEKQEVWLPEDLFSTEPKKSSRQDITCICFSPSEEMMVVSTNKNQLYKFTMLSTKPIRKISYFAYMNFPLHSNSITGLDMCIWKPILATCSLDRSVRIWNYKKNTLELCKEYQEEAHTVSLHPTGLFCLVGFSDKLRFISLLYEDMHVFKEFAVKKCRECSFSNGGHLFAIVNGNVIQIYSSITFENVTNLKGHTGKVHAIKWSADDTKFVSCDTHGAVHEWNLSSGKKESECVLKTCIYSSISLTYDAKIIFAVGSDQTLKEISESSIQHEVPAYDVVYTTVAVSRSGRLIFVGTSLGTIRAMKYPLTLKKKDFSEYQAHAGAVTKMTVTSDDQFLLTASEDGCVFIWKVYDKEGEGGKGEPEPEYAEEVLIMRSDIDEKTRAILDLQICVRDLQTESEYELRLKDMYYEGKIKALEENFAQEIDSLKTKHQILQGEKEKQRLQHEIQLSELMDKQAKEVQQLESDSSQKLSTENEKYQELQVKSQKMEEEYEKQLHNLEESKTKAVAELKELYEKKLKHKSVQLAEAKENMRKQIEAHEKMEKQIYEEGDKEILELKDKYEKQLLEEKESNIQLKGELGVMNKRLNSLQKELKDRNRDIEEMRLEQQKLQDIIKSLEKDISALKTDVKERTETILEKEKYVYDLKMKNQELQNFKFVLSYKIEEFKKQIESRENDIETMKKHIGEMEAELEQFRKESVELKLNITQLQQKQKATAGEVHREMEKRQNMETLIKRFKSDLHNCVRFINDSKKMKDGIRELYAKYVHQPDVVTEDADLQQQYKKQQEYNERNLAVLRKKVMKDKEMHHTAYMRIMQENVSLIKEINDLRQELRVANAQVHDLESALRLNKNKKAIQDTAPSGEISSSPAVLRLNPEMESEKIIEMQQLEIQYLRDQIQEMGKALNCPGSVSFSQKSS
uniref:Cilia and flagella associated protein 57 n=1 Tax=Serinus canaria TaxID=9135 RepID=A0A8C9NI57_SERCA